MRRLIALLSLFLASTLYAANVADLNPGTDVSWTSGGKLFEGYVVAVVSAERVTVQQTKPVADTKQWKRTAAVLTILGGTPQPPTQCADGVDNADPEDTLIDMADPGCANAADNDETNSVTPAPKKCANNLDDDGDGLKDFPADPGCTSASDDDESNVVDPGPGHDMGEFPAYIKLPEWNPATWPAGTIFKVWTGGTITDKGTVTAPIVYRNPAKITNRCDVQGGAAYLAFEDINQDRQQQSSAFNISGGAHHIIIRGGELANGQQTLTISASNVVVQGVKIHGTKPAGGWPNQDTDWHGVTIGGGQDIYIDKCEIYTNAGDSIQINNGGSNGVDKGIRRVYVTRNILRDDMQTGVWGKGVIDCVVARNKMSGHHASASGGRYGGGYQYGTKNFWLIENEASDNDTSFGATSVSGGPETSGYDWILYRNKTVSLSKPFNDDGGYSDGVDIGSWGNGLAAVENTFLRGIGYSGGRKCGGLNNTFATGPVIDDTTPLTAAEWTSLRTAYKNAFGKDLP